MRKWWKRVVGRETVLKIGRYEGMPEEQLAAALAPGDALPMWRAVHQVLDEEILQATERPLDPDLPGHKVRFFLGGEDALMRFKVTLMRRQAEAAAALREQERPPRGQPADEHDDD